MWNWLKRRNTDVAEREAARVKSELANTINAHLERWRINILDQCVHLMCDSFDERLVAIVAHDGMSIERLARTEGEAMLSKWRDSLRKCGSEALDYIPDNVMSLAEEHGMTAYIGRIVFDMCRDADTQLAQRMDAAIVEMTALEA